VFEISKITGDSVWGRHRLEFLALFGLLALLRAFHAFLLFARITVALLAFLDASLEFGAPSGALLTVFNAFLGAFVEFKSFLAFLLQQLLSAEFGQLRLNAGDGLTQVSARFIQFALFGGHVLQRSRQSRQFVASLLQFSFQSLLQFQILNLFLLLVQLFSSLCGEQ